MASDTPGQRGRYDVAGQFTRRRPGGGPERPSTDPCEAPYECRRVALASKALSWPVPAGGRRGHCVSVFGLRVLAVGKQRECRWSVPQVLAPRAVPVPRVLGPKVGDEVGLDQHSSPQLTSCHDRTRGKRPLDEFLVDGIEGWEVGHCRKEYSYPDDVGEGSPASTEIPVEHLHRESASVARCPPRSRCLSHRRGRLRRERENRRLGWLHYKPRPQSAGETCLSPPV